MRLLRAVQSPRSRAQHQRRQQPVQVPRRGLLHLHTPSHSPARHRPDISGMQVAW